MMVGILQHMTTGNQLVMYFYAQEAEGQNRKWREATSPLPQYFLQQSSPNSITGGGGEFSFKLPPRLCTEDSANT